MNCTFQFMEGRAREAIFRARVQQGARAINVRTEHIALCFFWCAVAASAYHDALVGPDTGAAVVVGAPMTRASSSRISDPHPGGVLSGAKVASGRARTPSGRNIWSLGRPSDSHAQMAREVSPIRPGVYGRYFIKASEGAQSVSRKAISLDADQLVRRADTESVTCTAAKGVSQDFSVKDCVAASHQLAEKKTSSATVGGCTLSLVNSKEKIAPGSISGHTLEKTTRQILKSCVKSVSEKEASTNDKDSLKIDQQQVVMLISKAA
ncbi:hypothetical protein PSTG_15600 [Puccinia striiformis f. sp. tritici PST-78]|uniref:Uncharacterized protein n=1 Tax=Puccinia striiformis f. sp. tritici PST-78 TaxID=1165861 RepID=A0A0L0UW74_9BASI|nr:hypothetical protein PSTG_15600 [Puccinia striiformis f. sp. tritici PST-78]